jgi:hypothetical protein
MVEHMKEHLIGKTVSDIEHIYTEDVYGEVQTGMKFTFQDGTTITLTIEKDDELSDRPNLDWHIKEGERVAV